MEIAKDFAPFQGQVTTALVKATRTMAQISSEDLNFQRSFNPDISEFLDLQSSRLLALTNSVLKVATSGSDLTPPDLQNEDSVEENWRAVVDVIDELLEKADASLDEFTGIIKKLSPSQQQRGLTLGSESNAARFPSIYDFGPSKIPKPQLSFERPSDNNNTSPFKPLLRSKPHAVVPLCESLENIHTDNVVTGYKHPYEREILNSRYPSNVYASSQPQKFQPFEMTTATFVDSLEGVNLMLAELKTAKEIALDLEHHDAHSYHGLVCLMQISTRDKDWIVDTLKPWREELQTLNEVLADPNILKVLHGSKMDVIWLQRDLGLYIVGLFDTYHASAVLNYAKRSLKFLLEKFVNLQAEKKYQMADWRLRPLLPGMFDYARSDTHYLLYIYDHVRNELLQHSKPGYNLIDYVLEKSKEEALQRYERPIYDAITGKGNGGWYDIISRNAALLSREQFAVLKAVHQWRDQTARAEDESVHYVLSKQGLFNLAHAMPLDPPSLLKAVSPVSPILRSRTSELIKVIKEAKISGATGPELRDVFSQSGPEVNPTSIATTLAPAPAELGFHSSLRSQDGEQAKVPRAETSQFWGSMLQNAAPSTAHAHSISASAEAVQLSLPLPPEAVMVLDVPGRPSDNSAAISVAMEPTMADSGPKDSVNEIFTIKQFGAPKKRKLSHINTPGEGLSPTVRTGESGSSPDLAEDPLSKPLNKTQRTISLLWSIEPEAATDIQQPLSSTPFDYTTAHSVLHANPIDTASPYSSNQTRRFDPYAKLLHGPQGLRKSKKEAAGKSLTFRK